jgi:pectin methylesterase-like acyl-CoA thioesterase
LVRELRRGALFGVVGRFAAIAAVLTVVALLFGLLLLPASRESDARTTSEVTGAITSARPQSSQQENGSKPALAAFQGFVAAPASQPSPPEQPQLLQQFLQWREKTNSAETSQRTKPLAR